MKVLWKVHSVDMGVASYRYRCFLPHFFLRQQSSNYRADIVSHDDVSPESYDALIVVKSYSTADLELAKRFNALQKPVFVDCCDNLFFDFPEKTEALKKRNRSFLKLRENFRTLAAMPGVCVVTPTLDLRELLAKNCKISRSEVVLDMQEDETCRAEIWKHVAPLKRWRFQVRGLYEIFKLRGLRDPLLMWFGNSGEEGVFGVTDLLLIKEELRAFYKQNKFTLIVCSDSPHKIQPVLAELGLPSFFVNWNMWIVWKLLPRVSACVFPNRQNDFSRGKSANRSLLALSFGTPVVASSTGASLDLATDLFIEDWQKNLQKAMANGPTRKIAPPRFQGSAVAKRWLELLSR